MIRTRSEHFIGLEWLRFLLGLYIIIFHTLHNYPEHKLPLIEQLSGLGFFATSAFFVLSGFLLAHVYCRNGQLREPAGSFLFKRFANLYPLHLVSLALTIAAIFVISQLAIPPDDLKASVRFVVYDTNEDLAGASRSVLEHWMGDAELLLNSVLQLLMLQAWNPYYLTFNPPLWSISALFFFYMTFPFLAPRLMTLKNKHRWLVALTLIYLLPPAWVIYHQELGMPFTGILHRMPLVRLPEFLAGILLYGLFRQMQDAGRTPRLGGRVVMGVFVLACFLGAAWLVQGAQFWYFLLHNGLLLPAQLVLIYLCALVRPLNSEWLRAWSQRLGTASLPMFVLHVPAFTLFSRSEKVLGVASQDCFVNWTTCAVAAGDQALSIAYYPLYLLLTVVLCLRVQERAVVPVRNYLVAKYRTPAAAVAVNETRSSAS